VVSVIGSLQPEARGKRANTPDKRGVPAPLRAVSHWIGRQLPTGLFARSMIIIVAPVFLLNSVIAYAFMERHWQTVTRRLSAAVTQDIASVIDVIGSYPQDADYSAITRIAGDRMGLDIEVLPHGPLPSPAPRPLLPILNRSLSNEIRRQIGRPFWIDTVSQPSLVKIQVQIDQGILSVTTRQSQAYASNSHIFLVWMLGSSVVLITIAIAFMRNQIRPILRLAEAAESFGMGRDVEFRPRGAREVRRAGYAFIEMKRRIERAMEQRTAMLNGVSHDLRTILTRFRLSLALIDDSAETEDLRKDVDEMSRMLEGYLAFARGDLGEQTSTVDMNAFLQEMRADMERAGHATTVSFSGNPLVQIRADAFRRCLGNLLSNAARYGDTIALSGSRDARWFSVIVDDDGPGIPPERRDDVFKPFVRLDEARNVDEGGSGLGLPIARDIARAHGGDVTLADSPLGGLRAIVRLPI
jgi:two-component system osmolarity sensor histidine kinase EnvZ